MQLIKCKMPMSIESYTQIHTHTLSTMITMLDKPQGQQQWKLLPIILLFPFSILVGQTVSWPTQQNTHTQTHTHTTIN